MIMPEEFATCDGDRCFINSLSPSRKLGYRERERERELIKLRTRPELLDEHMLSRGVHSSSHIREEKETSKDFILSFTLVSIH